MSIASKTPAPVRPQAPVCGAASTRGGHSAPHTGPTYGRQGRPAPSLTKAPDSDIKQ